MLVHRGSAAVALRALVDALQSDRPLAHVFAELLSQVRGLLAADEAYVLLLRGERLVLAAADGLPPGPPARSLGRAEGLEGIAASLRETVLVWNAATHRLFVDPFRRPSPPGAFVAAPLLIRGRASGVLVAARHEPSQLGEAGIWWLELLAGLVAVVVAQDEAVRFQEGRARHAELLLSLADVSPDEPRAFLAGLSAAIGRGFGADRVEVLLYDDARRELVPLVPPDAPSDARLARRIGAEHALMRAFEQGTTLVLDDVRADPALRAAYARGATRSVVAVPLRAGDDARGVLELASQQVGAFAPEDVAFLELVAARVGVLLEREEVRRRRSDARAREEFLGVVSHELKTPVAVTRAYLELLERRAQRDGRTGDLEVLASVADQTSRMLAMIEELLDVQRIETGIVQLELSRFDLAAAIERIAADLRVAAPEHQLEVDAVGPLTVVADRRRVEEIVTNLIENAVRYSPAGRPVRIRLQPQPDVARVEVIDRGPGIAPEDRTRIFDRFYRAARDRPHRGHHGLGLGLYVAREMVERHGGAIGVDATPGGGSTFWFTLPYDQS